jgi:hypothetical protein
MYVNKKEAIRLKDEFENWGIFDNVNYSWFNDFTYIVGFNYNHNAFYTLYKEWIRDKKIDKILN